MKNTPFTVILVASATLISISLAGSLAGCGYTLQNSQSPLTLHEGVEKIYIKPILNNTYKPGVENNVYNSLVRVLSAHGRVRIVQDRDLADATLEGTVSNASYGGSASAQVSNLNPTGLGSLLPTNNYVISTEYTATLVCSFKLLRTKMQPKHKKREIWASTFARGKPFPSANQLDVPGMTSPLINDSEFDRALSDLAHSMMEDVSESMLAMF